MPIRRVGIAIVSTGWKIFGHLHPGNFAARQTMYRFNNTGPRKAVQKVNPLRPRATIATSVKSRLQTIIHSANRCSSLRQRPPWAPVT